MSGLVHVFVGPSLFGAVRPDWPEFVWHPPAAQGDIYALVAERPRGIALIDGYFERVPAVWHKEILFALSEGIAVLGAASMGALRAAELSPFGMLGVGTIFEAFANGELTDDDEVTLIHADEQFGFRPLSEAMVNLRATLQAAKNQGLLDASEFQALNTALKRLHYPDRSYPALLEAARRELSETSWQHLARWLGDPQNRLDRKREDALELLARLRQLVDAAVEPQQGNWTFHHTDAWERVRQNLVRDRLTRSAPSHDFRPAHDRSRAVSLQRAQLRALKLQLARLSGFVPQRHDLDFEVTQFCGQHQLSDRARLAAFLAERNSNTHEFERLMQDEARIRYADLVFADDFEQALLDLAYLEDLARPSAMSDAGRLAPESA